MARLLKEGRIEMNGRNLALFLAGAASVILIEALRPRSQHDDQHDHSDHDGDDGQCGGVHERVDTQWDCGGTEVVYWSTF